MTKLAVLYTLIKGMNQKKAFNGALQIEGQMDQEVLGTLEAKVACGPESCTKSAVLKFGEETLRMEHEGTAKHFDTACCPPMKHAHACCGPRSRMKKAMFALKVLDKMALQEQTNGNKILTLNLDREDIPAPMGEWASDHCCSVIGGNCCSDHHQKLRDWMRHCGCLELNPKTLAPKGLSLTLTLDPQCAPMELSGALTATVSDKTGTEHLITINLSGQSSTDGYSHI